MVISNEPDVVQFDASSYFAGQHDVCVLTACDGILDHGKATRQNYADLFKSKKPDEDRNFSQRCVSYALNCGSRDNITATAAEFTALPTQGVLLGVFDGHGGKQTSQICKETVAVRCAGS
jgi:serine/threonine protein phosphatase PrpC